MTIEDRVFEVLAKGNRYEIAPVDNRKSFYGKATVCSLMNVGEVLISYTTPVIFRDADGSLYDLWGGWSATTGRHIYAFCGKRKKDVDKMEHIAI